MAPPHPACLPEEVLLLETEEEGLRASGPGGQHRNKVSTGVRLRHRPTGLVAQATERRSRPDNRRTALWRLRCALALQCRVAPGEVPSERWRRRTAGPSLAVSPGHEDVPALLAEALDMLAACDDELPRAAERLGVTATRLVKVLKLVPEALRDLNRRLERQQRPTWR